MRISVRRRRSTVAAPRLPYLEFQRAGIGCGLPSRRVARYRLAIPRCDWCGMPVPFFTAACKKAACRGLDESLWWHLEGRYASEHYGVEPE